MPYTTICLTLTLIKVFYTDKKVIYLQVQQVLNCHLDQNLKIKKSILDITEYV